MPTKSRFWTTLLPGVLATLLLGIGTIVQTAEAAQRVHTHAAVSQRGEPRLPHHGAVKERHETIAPVTAPFTAAPGPAVLSALQQAARATGTDPVLLLAIARRESGFDPVARSRSSSARGLMQFTTATWLEVVRDFGHRHGLTHQADALSVGPRGSAAASGRVVREVLRLRENPQLAAVMVAERLESWRKPLEEALGRAVTPNDLYFVHLLGPAGARRFLAELARAPAQSAAVVMATAVQANRGLFVQNGHMPSLAEVYRSLAISAS
jgi:hypothetical protein